MQTNDFNLDDKDKWLMMPNENTDSSVYEALIKKYHDENYSQVNISHHMDYTKFPQYHDKDYKQNYVFNIDYLPKFKKLKGLFLTVINADLSYIKELDERYLEYLVLAFTDKYFSQIKKSIKLDLSFVSKFSNLKTLHLSPDPVSPISLNMIVMPNVLNLGLRYHDLSAVDFSCFPNVQHLGLFCKNDAIEKYHLEKCNKLKTLYIQGFPKTTNLSFLSELTNLESIHIVGFSLIQKLPDLSKLTKLKCLFLDCKGLKDFSTLGDVPNLEQIAISRISKDFDVASFAPLAQLKSLNQFKYLYDYQKVSEIKKLKEMFGEKTGKPNVN